MEEKTEKSVTIINRNYPPIAGVTGGSALELAGYLEFEHGIRVKIVHVDGSYGGGGAKGKKPVGEVHKVKTFYNGKKVLPRFISAYFESRSLIIKAKKIAGDGPIIVMTDPPFLNYWAAKIFKNNYPWIIWTMDLYPDAFVSKGLIKKSGFAYKQYKKKLLKYPPARLITLGLLQTKYIEDFYGKTFPTTVLPCGIYKSDENSAVPEWRNDESKVYFGYCGNLGEAHSVEMVEVAIKCLDPSKHVFVLSVYGAKANQILSIIENYDVVKLVDSVPRPQLQFIDVHLVSLLDKWVHVCVPSKAVSAVCSGASILFYGSKETDNWELLSEGGWKLEQKDDLEDQIKTFISNIDNDKIIAKRKQSAALAVSLNEEKLKAFNDIAFMIKET